MIDSVTRSVKRVNHTDQSILESDAELAFLNALPDLGASAALGSPADLARGWLDKVDANANLVAPQVRRRAAIPILCTAAAALLSAAAASLPKSGIWLVTGAVLGICASRLPKLLKISDHQALWARTRIPAEISRSVLAVWLTPRRYQAVSPEMFPELRAMLCSLAVLKARDPLADGAPIEDFKAVYLRERIEGQIAYFQRHATRATRDAARYKRAAAIATGFATAFSVALVIVKNSALKQLLHGHFLDRAALAPTLMFQFATIAGALLAVRDSERRARRYTELSAEMESLGCTFRALQSWFPLLQVVSRVERTLLSELLEWKVLMRNRKIAKT